MHLEEGVPAMLATGFYGIMAIAICLLAFLMIRYKAAKMVPFFIFLILFLSAGHYLLKAINVVRSDVPLAMQSEEASLNMGLAGVFWAFAMAAFLFGAGRSLRHSK
ncbi:hypothetical protein [Bacillus sp. FJAT-27445]|uniref:hypothetical protein n=1 Tax=Bacillus sp. FJAT-27445 TaxID=1679166 RepID=UPI00074332FE|nr:hypothetical protein [Bacillus sp. FJAT-27445]